MAYTARIPRMTESCFSPYGTLPTYPPSPPREGPCGTWGQYTRGRLYPWDPYYPDPREYVPPPIVYIR